MQASLERDGTWLKLLLKNVALLAERQAKPSLASSRGFERPVLGRNLPFAVGAWNGNYR
jgi:hypothetical protein